MRRIPGFGTPGGYRGIPVHARLLTAGQRPGPSPATRSAGGPGPPQREPLLLPCPPQLPYSGRSESLTTVEVYKPDRIPGCSRPEAYG